MKNKTNISVKDIRGIRVTPDLVIGPQGDYVSGDILDANATQELINGSTPTPAPETIPIEYSDLFDLYKAENLQPGVYYRIKDYTAVTFQEKTKSAGHKFDIIVHALDEKTLAEEAFAAFSDTDPYFKENGARLNAWKVWYTIDNNDPRFLWAHITDEQLSTVEYNISYDGLPESLVEALDGDSPFTFEKVDTLYEVDLGYCKIVSTERPYLGCKVEIEYEGSKLTSVINEMTDIDLPSKGVVYRLIDEWNNDCPYDFKNILFQRWAITSASDGEAAGFIVYDEVNSPIRYATQKTPYITGNNIMITPDGEDSAFYYTFTWRTEDGELPDASILGPTLKDDEENFKGVFNNKIGSLPVSNDFGGTVEEFCFVLSNNVFIVGFPYDGGIFYGLFNNYFLGRVFNNTFYGEITDNTFAGAVYKNTFAGAVYKNIFTGEVRNNVTGSVQNNTFSGNVYDNTLLRGVGENNISGSVHDSSASRGVFLNTFSGEVFDCTFVYRVQRCFFGGNIVEATYDSVLEDKIYGVTLA